MEKKDQLREVNYLRGEGESGSINSKTAVKSRINRKYRLGESDQELTKALGLV